MIFVAEQEIEINHPKTGVRRVILRISEPRLEKDRDDNPVWACYPKLDGLFDLEKPVHGISSFQAMVLALQACRQLIRDESKGAKLYMIDNLRGQGLFPADGLSLKELFEMQ